ncbi:MAG: pinensin family lanthipeptide [Acidobacteriota bacterium]|nr:pinensin family lanthipeptide [Acidobacteriota bacterium]
MKLRLEDIRIKSFVTDLEKRGLRAGAALGAVADDIGPIGQSFDDCSPYCGPTFWKTCEPCIDQ